MLETKCKEEAHEIMFLLKVKGIIMPAFLKCKTCFLRENMGCFKGIPQHTCSQINFLSKIISFEIFGVCVCVALNMFDFLRNLVIVLVLMLFLSYQSGNVLAKKKKKRK